MADSGVYGESVTAGNPLPGGGMTYPYPLAVDSELLDMERSWMWKALGQGSRGTTAYSVQRSAGSETEAGSCGPAYGGGASKDPADRNIKSSDKEKRFPARRLGTAIRMTAPRKGHR